MPWCVVAVVPEMDTCLTIPAGMTRHRLRVQRDLGLTAIDAATGAGSSCTLPVPVGASSPQAMQPSQANSKNHLIPISITFQGLR